MTIFSAVRVYIHSIKEQGMKKMEKLKNRTAPLKTSSVSSIFRNICIQSVYFILSFLFGGISFAGGLSPFAAGFAGGTEISFAVASSLGAAAGYVVFFGLFDSLRLVGAAVIICILKLFIQPNADFTYKNTITAILTGIGSFAVSLCVYLAVPGEGIFLIMCFCEALIASAFAVFSRRVQDIIREKRKNDRISKIYKA